jgi:uncharacterized membrane protein YgcG
MVRIFGLGRDSGSSKKIGNFIYKGDQKKLPSPMNKIKTVTDDDGIFLGGVANNELPSTDNRISDYTEIYNSIFNNRFLYFNSYEAFFAVSQIVNEAVVVSNNTKDASNNVEIDLTQLEVHDIVKDEIRKSFDNIKVMLNWKQNGQSLFRKWYIDGRKYFLPVVSSEYPTEGILEIRPLSPFFISKDFNDRNSNYGDVDEDSEDSERNDWHWLLVDKDGNRFQLDADLLVCVDSGFYSMNNGEAVSYLSLAEKHYNRLDLVENSAVIYRVVRAPERRVFYVQIRKTNKSKVKSQIRDLIRAYSNSSIFDDKMNKINSKKAFVSMTNDIWLTEDSEGRGTKVDTLQGGQQVGETADIDYLKRNYIRSLNIPLAMYFDQGGFNFSLGTQITEEKVTFFNFISSLRNQWDNLWIDLMKIDLIAKMVFNESEWDDIRSKINFKWTSSSYFHELKELEVLGLKADIIDRFDNYVGRYFDIDFVYSDILGWSDERIKDMKQRVSIFNSQNTGDAGNAGLDGGGGSSGSSSNMGSSGGGGANSGIFADEGDLGGEPELEPEPEPEADEGEI